MQDSFARARTRPKGARDDRVSCIQSIVISYVRPLIRGFGIAIFGKFLRFGFVNFL